MPSDLLDIHARMDELGQISQELKQLIVSTQPTQEQLVGLAERVRQGLELLERRIRAVLNSTLDGYLLIEADGHIRDVNPSYCHMVGYSREELLGKTIDELDCGRTDSPPQQSARETYCSRSARFETRHRRKDGQTIDLDVSVSIVQREQRPPRSVAFVRDITEQTRTKALLEAQNRMLRRVASGEPLSDILEALTRSVESQCQGLLASILLLDQDGKRLRHGAAPSLPDEYNRSIDGLEIGPQAGSCGSAAYYNRRVIVTDTLKDPLWADFRDLAARFHLRACWSQPIRSSGGSVLGTFALYYREPRDPTQYELDVIQAAADLAGLAIERSRALQALQESEERFRQLGRLALEGIVVHENGYILEVNDTFARMFGYEPEELIGFYGPKLAVPRDQAIVERQISSGDETLYEAVGQRKDGTTFPAVVIGRPVSYRGRRARVAVIRDISEQKKTEAEREALIAELEAKNSELEQFTYTVSHDLRSPLITVKGFLDHLRQDLAEGNAQAVQEDIEQMETAVRRMDDLLTELLRLSRAGRPMGPSADVSLKELIQETLEVLNETIAQSQVQMVVAPDFPVVRGDRRRLGEVFQNLIDNAIKFSTNRPDPRVEIRCRKTQDRAVIEIRDNGIGISPQNRHRVFRVFEKLDPTTDGTGLGLAISKRIVEAHGGSIWIESEGSGQGTTVCVSLPLA
ncbi:MAG: PAS domain S-box protein [Planctomycetes bacterium]|nr:PAS domain S-box protein [Planctomycetota bacterium]